MRLPHQPQAPVQTVEKQADVLEKKDPAAGGGRGLQLGEPLVDVLLRLGYVQVLADDVVEGVETFFFILQTEEGTGMTLGQVMFCEQAAAVRESRSRRSLLARAEGERPSRAAASSCVEPD